MTRPDDDSFSPLFDKMDALIARHRGAPAYEEQIPVLTHEVDGHPNLTPTRQPSTTPEESIPVLTETVETGELMFDPTEFFSKPAPLPSNAPAAATPSITHHEPEFLNLPVLDLDTLAAQAPSVDTFDFDDLLTSPNESTTESATITSTVNNTDDWADFVTETAPQPAASKPDAAHRIETTAVADLVEQSVPTPTLPNAADTELQISFNDETSWDLRLEPDAYPLQAEPAMSMGSTTLDKTTINEITASVGAQLAVDIASEIEQLTRQHFSALINTLYSETLNQLTTEIAQELDHRLAPRISQLVEDELRRQQLLR